MFALTSELDIGRVLLDIFIVLFAAKVAAEVAERIGVPAVLGEILAGVLIGPSVLGFVIPSDTLFILGEIGVILLLLNVGMEMDLAELGKVGKASLVVAIIGIVVPFATGAMAGLALGQEMQTAIFLGAALTATSVGITARVFGDLRALATTEARVVLGAAVADDVLGLIILTVVAGAVEKGSVSAGTVFGVIGMAALFLVLAGGISIVAAPRLFSTIQRVSRSSATLTATAFALALALSVLADVAHLAPIIGAFIAGLAMGRTRQAERINGELNGLGHIFIPVFFLQIGIDTDVASLVRPKVLVLAGALLVVAVIGKLVAGYGTGSLKADRLLVGIGMIPRGEVGLIFATLGLRNGVLDDDMYAALLLVVLVTTMITPPLLRRRVASTASEVVEIDGGNDSRPPTGWVVEGADGFSFLVGDPPTSAALAVALDTALAVRDSRMDDELATWLADRRMVPLTWDSTATDQLKQLLRTGTARSWQLLSATGTLDRAFPELHETLEHRRRDLSELDPGRALRLPTVSRLVESTQTASGIRVDLVDLAAFVLDLVGSPPPPGLGEAVLDRLGLSDEDALDVAFLASNAELLRAAARDPDSYEPSRLRQLADHVERPERARELAVLGRAITETEVWHSKAIDELTGEVVRTLGSASSGPRTSPRQSAAARRQAAQRLAASPQISERLEHAPRLFLLAHEPDELARQAQLLEPAPSADTVRVAVSASEDPRRWTVDVACRDRSGLLARLSAGLMAEGCDITAASCSTWPDGAVLDSFQVLSINRPSPRQLAEGLEAALKSRIPSLIPIECDIEFDDMSLPWHTRCTLSSAPGTPLIQAATAACADLSLEVHHALVTTDDSGVVLRLALTDRRGTKLDATGRARFVGLLGGTPARRRLHL